LDTTGAGVMEEEPPESLKSRYSGWFDGNSHSSHRLNFHALAVYQTK
jgi:hypothetical protein